MELKKITFNEVKNLMENPQREQDCLIVWHACWSAPALCFMKKLKEMPEIPDIKVCVIDIEEPPIEMDKLSELRITAVPTCTVLKIGKPGFYKQKSGVISYEELCAWLQA